VGADNRTFCLMEVEMKNEDCAELQGNDGRLKRQQKEEEEESTH